MSEKVATPAPHGHPAQSYQSHPVSLPNRQVSVSSTPSDDAAIPSTDPLNTSELLAERLQAWKHAVGYLEEYVTATEKAQKAYAKEYEKVLKTIQNPLREGHHFDQSLGGVAGLVENMRQNTQGLVNTRIETEKNLKGSVLPILERLHQEIKNKAKELDSGAVKNAKAVDKARNTTQKHIELLGQNTANFQSTGGKVHAADDPYVIQRGVYHRLGRQVMEENNHRNDLVAVQTNFEHFEGHLIEVIQQALMSFNQFVGGQAQKEQQLYNDILGNAQQIPLNFEWTRFTQRNAAMLVDPNAPERTIDSIQFANQNHKSTQPLIEGSLERKSRNKLSFGGYSTGYYVVTPSGFLHEFKDNDNFKKDPEPELSIYLPDAVIGSVSGEKFNVKGKDVSKGIGSKLSGSSEISFKAHTAADASTWAAVIKAASGASSTEPYTSTPTSPISPVEKRQTGLPAYAEGNTSPVAEKTPAPLQTSGITGGEHVASPTTATPISPNQQKYSPGVAPTPGVGTTSGAGSSSTAPGGTGPVVAPQEKA